MKIIRIYKKNSASLRSAWLHSNLIPQKILASLCSALFHSKVLPHLPTFIIQYFRTYIRIIQCWTICKTFKYQYIPFKYRNWLGLDHSYWHWHSYCCWPIIYCYCSRGTFIISEWKILLKEHYYTCLDVKKISLKRK